jgi:hypothetical protein
MGRSVGLLLVSGEKRRKQGPKRSSIQVVEDQEGPCCILQEGVLSLSQENWESLKDFRWQQHQMFVREMVWKKPVRMLLRQVASKIVLNITV